ncbi:helix-turn-helix domain-containing protein [Microcoleus asticus]|uniref:HTH cro/C1-type domain-containing protein n=1 Tax=Microcoleus asticus IPMA8 TaxID=2563858 RepID=A0ABX2D7D9_9CYAN|nr:helix-turn-helix domain-containing protein [Microcoleus asticus]NQE38483.1 hypothetical protein [Microcoleus asticus IPMA8]
MGKINVSKAIELYESGMSQKEVAETLGVSQEGISRAFRKLGYVSREKGNCSTPLTRERDRH